MSNYPTVRPSLTLDFQKSKQLDPRIAFSRSSAATYVEGGVIKTADEHQARFEDEGLLIEESRTNLLPESGNLNDQTYWNTSTNPGSLNQAANQGWMVATSNTTEVVSPDGTNNATKLAGNTASTFDKNYKVHVVPNVSSVSMSANVVYTWTLFVKDPDSVLNSDNLLVFMYGSRYSNVNARVKFDLSNDTVTYGGNISNESASITPYPNGWKKLTATWTNTSSGGGPRYYLEEQSPKTGGVTQFSANGDKFYVWGFQIEEGSFPTSYIPTAGSTVTRAPDQAILSGTNVTSWYNITEGTVCSKAMSPLDLTTSRLVWHFRDPGRKEHNADNGFQWYDLGTGYSTNGSTYVAGVFNKQAYAYSSVVGSSTRACLNGTFLYDKTVDPNITPSAHTTLSLGSNVGVNIFVNGYIQRFSYYSERLTDEQLEALTS